MTTTHRDSAAASKEEEMRRQTQAAPVIAMGLAALFFTGCYVDESLDGEGQAPERRAPDASAAARVLETVATNSQARFGEVHKPGAPRTLRTWTTAQGERTYEVVDGEVILEGDMIMGPVEEFEARLKRGDVSAFGVGRDGGRWGMPVKYSFADSISPELRSNIELALNRLVSQSTANISFSQCTGLCMGSHLKFKYESGGGCSSYVGQYTWPLVNGVNLDNHCDGRDVWGWEFNREIGSLMHEVMHALGVYHMQSRCDRDNFVSIQWHNIESGWSYNFDQECSGATDYGPYDFASIMHYPAWALSNGNGPTIVPHDPNNAGMMGSRQELSFGDRNVLRAMYGGQCSPYRTTCYAGECGYPDVGCGIRLNCGPCPGCEGPYCNDGTCCPSSGFCSDGTQCSMY